MTTRAVLSVRDTEPDDLAALAELYRHGFGRPLLPEEWEWKYRRLPGEARSAVARDATGELVAHVGAYALPARWRGEERLAWQLADFVGRPGGLRPPLVVAGRALLAPLPRPSDLPFVFGFPSSRHLALGERVFGYRWLPPITPWEGELAAVPPPADPGLVVAQGDTAGEWAEAAWSACAVDSVRRSVAFLNWRYHARPQRYYRMYRLRDAGGEPGLVVAGFAGDVAQLAEVWIAGDEDHWLACMAAVAADLRAAGLVRWRAWPPPAASAERLRALGMAPLADDVPCGCRGGQSTSDEIVALAGSLYYAMGDHDLV